MKSLKIKTKNSFYRAFLKFDETINFLNTNTLFIGLMMFVMNIASRFVNIRLSRSMEGYMKFSFSKDILVFAIAFIGTRDLYWALVITLLFMLCTDFLLNEESAFCCLPESFTSHHISMLDKSLDASGNVTKSGEKGGNKVIPGIGVNLNNSSISGAPGLGYSTGNKMEIEEDIGELTEEEKKKVSEVLANMRGNGSGWKKRDDGPMSALYSSY
jgi:hypothetical protein